MDRLRVFWNRGWFAKAIVSIVGLLILCCVIGILVPRRTPATTTSQPTAAAVEPQATTVPEPTSAPEPTGIPATAAPTVVYVKPTPKPTYAPPPEPSASSIADQVRTVVDAALSNSNRKVDRITTTTTDPDQQEPQIFIRWAINDNLTEKLIKAGARLDIEKMLKAIQELNIPYTAVLIEGTFPLVDKLGNSEEAVVIHALYPKATIDKINWPNFNRDNVYAIADDVTIHPAFRE